MPSASAEKWTCSRRSIMVDREAMPIEPPRLRIMFDSDEASAVSRGLRPAVESWLNGMENRGRPIARSSCGRISWSMPTSWVRPTLIQQLATKNKVPVATSRRASKVRMMKGIVDGRSDRQAWAQSRQHRVVGVKRDPHRHALNNLGGIAGGVFRGQKSELRSGPGGKTDDGVTPGVGALFGTIE